MTDKILIEASTTGAMVEDYGNYVGLAFRTKKGESILVRLKPKQARKFKRQLNDAIRRAK